MKKSIAISLGFLLLVSIIGFAVAENSTSTNTSDLNSGSAASNVSGSNDSSVTSNTTIPPANASTNMPVLNGTPRFKEPTTREGEDGAHSAIATTFAREGEDKPLPYPNMPNKDPEEINTNRMLSLSNELQCRINFNIGVLNSIMNASPNSTQDLQPIITQLQNFLSQAQSGGNNTNITTFSQDYSSEMKSAVGIVNSWRNQEGDKIPLRVRAELVDSYKNLSDQYNQCEGTAFTNISQQRINEYQMQINNFQNQSNSLANRGFNTSSIDQLLADAQAQIMVPLQNALSTANDSASIKQALGSYCLFDGCTNGTNFHLDAKFNIARVSIVLNDLQANADAFSLNNATISQAQQYLANAQSTLDSVGTSAYQKGQSQTIFSNIQQASKIVVQLMAQVLKQPIGGLK